MNSRIVSAEPQHAGQRLSRLQVSVVAARAVDVLVVKAAGILLFLFYPQGKLWPRGALFVQGPAWGCTCGDSSL